MSGTDSMSDRGWPAAPASTEPTAGAVTLQAVGPGDVVGRYRVVSLLGSARSTPSLASQRR